MTNDPSLSDVYKIDTWVTARGHSLALHRRQAQHPAQGPLDHQVGIGIKMWKECLTISLGRKDSKRT